MAATPKLTARCVLPTPGRAAEPHVSGDICVRSTLGCMLKSKSSRVFRCGRRVDLLALFRRRWTLSSSCASKRSVRNSEYRPFPSSPPRGRKFCRYPIVPCYFALDTQPLEGLNLPSKWMANSRLADCQFSIGPPIDAFNVSGTSVHTNSRSSASLLAVVLISSTLCLQFTLVIGHVLQHQRMVCVRMPHAFGRIFFHSKNAIQKMAFSSFAEGISEP